MRIVFLTNNNDNIVSMACLGALVADGSHSVVVGLNTRRRLGLLETITRAYRLRGLRYVLRRGLHRCRAKLHTVARKLGARSSSYRSLRKMVEGLRLEHFECGRINSAETVKRIRMASPELIVVASFGQILKAEVIAIPRQGAINLHPSLLPRYRGSNPFYWVLKNGEERTGVTVHYIDEGIDTGDIILQREIPVRPHDTELTLRDRAAEVAPGIIVEAVRRIADGSAARIPQDPAEASYYEIPPPGESIL